MREWLIESFDYDLWANRIWGRVLEISVDSAMQERMNGLGPWPDFPSGSERAAEVFLHIVWAQRVWLERVGPRLVLEGSDPLVWLGDLHAGWAGELRRRDPGEEIEYRNSRGTAGRRSIAQIGRHVADHGTYHRGQLREILGVDASPETSPVTYFASFDSAGA